MPLQQLQHKPVTRTRSAQFRKLLCNGHRVGRGGCDVMGIDDFIFPRRIEMMHDTNNIGENVQQIFRIYVSGQKNRCILVL